jgi:hypothetical protein
MTECTGLLRPMPGGPLQGRGDGATGHVTQGKRFFTL